MAHHPALSLAVSALAYQLAKQEERPITEEEIYQAFLGNTTPETVTAFREVYRRLHGGEF